MRRTINYKHLYYFYETAKDCSITQASKRIHITPQTISGQISLLEEQLDTRLFIKKGRSLRLPSAGSIAFDYAKDIFELGYDLLDILDGQKKVESIDFAVGIVSTLPKTSVYKIIEPALNLEHDVNLVCQEGSFKPLLAKLAAHDIDMVLSETPFTGNMNIKVYNHFLGESGISFFAAKKIARNLKKDFPYSLNGTNLLLPSEQFLIRQNIQAWLMRNAISPVLKAQFDDSALIKSFGSSGYGVFFAPSIIQDEVCRSFNVSVIGEIQEVKQSFYAISQERKIRHPAIEAICSSARSSIFS